MNEKGIITLEPDMKKIYDELFSVSVNDKDTVTTIEEVYSEYGILLEPHGAVAWQGLNEYLGLHGKCNSAGTLSIVLETAHPAKFPEEIARLIGIEPPLPGSLQGLEGKQEFVTALPTDYDAFKQFLLCTF